MFNIVPEKGAAEVTIEGGGALSPHFIEKIRRWLMENPHLWAEPGPTLQPKPDWWKDMGKPDWWKDMGGK